MPPGRPRSQQPTLAFERRRYLTLVQTLALPETVEGRLSALRHLARAWELGDEGDYQALVSRLAAHAIEYHRNEDEVIV